MKIIFDFYPTNTLENHFEKVVTCSKSFFLERRILRTITPFFNQYPNGAVGCAFFSNGAIISRKYRYDLTTSKPYFLQNCFSARTSNF